MKKMQGTLLTSFLTLSSISVTQSPVETVKPILPLNNSIEQSCMVQRMLALQQHRIDAALKYWKQHGHECDTTTPQDRP